jgi:hypothetical protein
MFPLRMEEILHQLIGGSHPILQKSWSTRFNHPFGGF